MKERLKTNFIIDILLFINIAAVGGIGFLMKYVLVPGSDRWEKYGSNAELYLLNLDRHQWGDLHLILSYIMLGLLLLHIVFHWYQIKCMARKTVPCPLLRTLLIILLIPVTLLFFLYAFLLPVESDPVKTGEGRHRVELGRSIPADAEPEPVSVRTQPAPEHIPDQEEPHQDHTLEIFGSSSLRDVALKYGVPADSIKKFLGIPLKISDNQRLGRLRRIYNFHMSDIERYIETYMKRTGG